MRKHKIVGYIHTQDLKTVTDQDIKDLDVINIAFGSISSNSTISYDTQDTLEQVARFKKINPTIKFLLSIGGWSSGNFSEAAFTEENRKKVAKSAVEVVEKNNIDGIDLDWEYPSYTVAGIGGCKEDKKNFTLLLKEIREALDPKYMLTIAAGGAEYYLRGVEMSEVIKYLDYVQLMTYDLRGGFQVLTGHHTSLYEAELDLFKASVDTAVKDFMEAGVPAEKIVIGAAFYSRQWGGVPDVDNGLIQMAETTGGYGPGYGTLMDEYVNKNGFVRYWDDVAKAPYLYNKESKKFISYEDIESITNKIEYMKEKGLLGIMYWEYCTDHTKTLTGIMKKEIERG